MTSSKGILSTELRGCRNKAFSYGESAQKTLYTNSAVFVEKKLPAKI